jgi:hypothetical protein
VVHGRLPVSDGLPSGTGCRSKFQMCKRRCLFVAAGKLHSAPCFAYSE